MLFCSLKKGLTSKMCMLYFVVINSLLFNLFYTLVFMCMAIWITLNKKKKASCSSITTEGTGFLQPLLYLVTPYVPENCQLMSSFLLVLKQWYVCYKQLSYIRHLFYVAMLLMPAQTKPKLFELRWNSFFFSYPG